MSNADRFLAAHAKASKAADDEMPRARMYGWNETSTWHQVYWGVMQGHGYTPYLPFPVSTTVHIYRARLC